MLRAYQFYLYPAAFRFDEFFHGIFKTPQITNGNLKVAVLLVESNTMLFDLVQRGVRHNHTTSNVEF